MKRAQRDGFIIVFNSGTMNAAGKLHDLSYLNSPPF